jgi:hypothetical protein
MTTDDEELVGADRENVATCSDVFLAGLRRGGGFFLMGRATLGRGMTGEKVSPDGWALNCSLLACSRWFLAVSEHMHFITFSQVSRVHP